MGYRTVDEPPTRGERLAEAKVKAKERIAHLERELRKLPTPTEDLDLSERCEGIAHRLLDALKHGNIQDRPLQTMQAAGIAIDKMLLLRGQPTQIVGMGDDLSAEDRRALREALSVSLGTERENYLVSAKPGNSEDGAGK